MAAPVRRDDELELRIDSLAYGGNGVARLDGFVVFVRRGLPGDVVRARVTKVKRSHAEASREVVEPGAPRVDAPCEHYPACGGCRFQDLAYEAQLEAKEGQVRDALLRIGRLAEPPLEPIVPAESVFHYRNKLEYSFTQTPDGPALGFHRAGRWDEVLDIDECWLTTDLGNAIRDAVREWAREERLAGLRPGRAHGLPPPPRRARRAEHRPGARPARDRARRAFDARAASSPRCERFPEVRSIHWAVNDTPAEVTNLPTELLWGEEAIEEEILGLRFRVRPNAFLQTNTEMAERLYALAREYAGLTGEENVYDLYCGTGTIGLALAARGAHRLGRRGLRGVRRLRDRERGAQRHRQRGVLRRRTSASRSRSCASGRATRTSSSSTRRAPVSPGKALRRLGRARARLGSSTSRATRRRSPATPRCSATSTATSSSACRPVDMFPHTPHVESVALLERDCRLLRAERAPGVAPSAAGARAGRRSGAGSRGDDSGQRRQPGDAERRGDRRASRRGRRSCASHVQPARSRKRRAAARKSAKKRMSGSPSLRGVVLARAPGRRREWSKSPAGAR